MARIPFHDVTEIVKPKGEHQPKPCPFCGCDEIAVANYEHTSGKRWLVVCCNCMAMIDPGYAQEPFTVIRMWNKRANETEV